MLCEAGSNNAFVSLPMNINTGTGQKLKNVAGYCNFNGLTGC